MAKLWLNSALRDDDRRFSLFQGDVYLFAAKRATLAICDLVRAMLLEAFPEVEDPREAQFHLSNAEFFGRLTKLRAQLRGSLEAKEAIRDVLSEFGCDLADTYFDVLRLRAVTSGGHENPEAAPAYFVHRDIWYANPESQLNWWIPLYDITMDEAFVFYPEYWERPIANSSAGFEYDAFVAQGGWQAYGGARERSLQEHPAPTEPVSDWNEMKIACKRGEAILFSAAQLHATMPHTSGETRFSVDFRTVSLDDLKLGRAAPSLDNASKGSTLRDFLSAKDFSPFP